MQDNDQNKKKISEELRINFEEAVELFSEETLSSMKMEHVVGGTCSWNTNIECVVVNNAKKCKVNNC